MQILARRHRLCMLLAAWLAGPICYAQERPVYPTRPVRVIVPLVAGGNLDLVARAIAQEMAENTGQQFIVENRPSASGITAAQFVAKGPADGYTILGIADTFAMAPNVVAAAGYHSIRDFIGVSLTARLPHVRVVNLSLPVRTVKDLIALAKKRPGEFTYGSADAGSNGHVAGLLPELPTIAEAALPAFEAMVFNALMAPAGLPRDVLSRLRSEVAQAAQSPELRERFLRQGVEIVASDSAEQFAEFLKSETARYARIARDAGIKDE